MGFKCSMIARSSCCLVSSVHLTIFAIGEEKVVDVDVVSSV